MNPQYSQPPPPNQNFQAPPQQPNYNGNQFPPNVIFFTSIYAFHKKFNSSNISRTEFAESNGWFIIE